MSKVYMFSEGTSKIDIINNTNAVDLEKYTMDYKINFKLDSCHILTLILDVNLLKEDNMLLEIDGKKTLKVSHQNDYEVFDICEIDKMLDTVEVTARQWSIEKQRAMFIVDTKPRNLGSLAMMDWLKSNTEQFKQGKQFARDLEIDGNITDLISTNIWHDNFYNATCDLVELYGGEIKREKFKVSLVDYVGSKTAKYKIEYAVNLLENNAENQYDIVIGVLPKGYDKLYGDIVYSGLLKEHPNIVGQTIEKEYKIRVREEGKEDEDGWIYYDTENEAKVALQELATKEFTENHIDQPIISFTTKFLDLSTTDDFKDQPKVFLSVGDKVNTVIPHYDIDIETRIIEMVYDGMLGEYTDIILSNNDIKSLTPPTISSISKEVEKLPSIDEVIDTARKESEAIVNQGFNGYVHYKPNYTAWTDTQDIKQSHKGLCANRNGWFFYNKGINPETGFPNPDGSTMIADVNGNFNASCINSGRINCGLLKVGIISSIDGSISINIENGEFRIGGRNGDVAKHTPTYSEWKNKDGSITRVDANGFYNQVGSTKREYHHLNFTKKITFPATSGSGGGYTSTIVALPTEFKGKTITATASISNAPGNYVPSSWGVVGTVSTMVDVMSDNTLKVYGQLLCWDTKNNTWHNLNERLEVTVTAIA